MKTLIARTLSAVCGLALLGAAQAQPGPDETVVTNAPENSGEANGIVAPDPTAPPPAAEIPQEMIDAAAPDQPAGQPAAPAEAQPAPQPATPARRASPPPQTLVAPSSLTEFPAPAPATGSGGPNELHLNFRNAPIEMVLNYLSDAAGFIIELDTPVRGRVDIWSNQAVTKDEAVELLNSVLNKNGYAVIRNGRTLRVMNHDDALHSDIPVHVSNEPDSIPKTDEIVTQIIPIRFVEAKQLISDLSPLVSSHATIIANEAGNSIVVTDTQANIRHLVEVIKAIDTSAEDVTEVRVFHLQYHDPVEVAGILTSLFADQNSGNQTPIRFGGGRFGGGFGGCGGFVARMMAAQQGGGGGNNSNNSNDRIKKHARVVAVADQRSQSVVVTAAKDLMDQIGEMVDQLDHESPKISHVSVIHLENADPQEVQQVLQDMFQNGNTRNGRGGSQSSPLMTRSQGNQNQYNNNATIGGFGGNNAFGGGGNRGGFGGQ